jgi:carbamoyl-phosphate synthase large subunit
MKSTGEVMGVGETFAEAFYKGLLGAGDALPKSGKVFISVRDVDKSGVVEVARDMAALGFELVATRGTFRVLQEAGITVTTVNKMSEGRPHIVDMIKNDEIALVVNTTEGRQAIRDSADIRRSAENHQVCYTTTLAAAKAMAMSMQIGEPTRVRRLQDLHQQVVKLPN